MASHSYNTRNRWFSGMILHFMISAHNLVQKHWDKTTFTVSFYIFWQVKRPGDKNVRCTILLLLDYQPLQFKLDQRLARLLGLHTQTRPVIISALWQYIKTHKLQVMIIWYTECRLPLKISMSSWYTNCLHYCFKPGCSWKRVCQLRSLSETNISNGSHEICRDSATA